MLKLILYVIIIYALVIMAARYDFDADNADYLIVLGSSLNKDMETFTLINRVNRAERYLKKEPGLSCYRIGRHHRQQYDL